jgi:DNA modification methylase
MPGDIVLDPFAGSGTTIVVAGANGRKSVGIEISSKYVKITCKRVSDLIAGSLRMTTPLNVKSTSALTTKIRGGVHAKRSS